MITCFGIIINFADKEMQMALDFLIFSFLRISADPKNLLADKIIRGILLFVSLSSFSFKLKLRGLFPASFSWNLNLEEKTCFLD